VYAILPHLATASRVALGAAAVIAALGDELFLAASLITLAALADGVDGHLARRLGTSSPFGALFDYFCDYLTLVVAPWLLGRAILAGSPTVAQEVALALPLLTGAIRYARNGATMVTTREAPDLPGVGTVFSAFVSVTAVFLDAGTRLGPGPLGVVIPGAVAILALLMLAPVRYPKLTRFRGWSPTVLVLLAVMPFAGTTVLAATAVVLGLVYIAFAPLLTRS
jgi:CDP-diacylglycerol--serine O-phosphatidyltransferase